MSTEYILLCLDAICDIHYYTTIDKMRILRDLR